MQIQFAFQLFLINKHHIKRPNISDEALKSNAVLMNIHMLPLMDGRQCSASGARLPPISVRHRAVQVSQTAIFILELSKILPYAPKLKAK